MSIRSDLQISYVSQRYLSAVFTSGKTRHVLSWKFDLHHNDRVWGGGVFIGKEIRSTIRTCKMKVPKF